MPPPRIDTHSHFLPPFYREALQQNGHGKPDGMPAVPEWSEEAHLDLMRALDISRSILSISSPGTHLVRGDDAAAAALTRSCNAYAAALKRRHPAKFGFWASLPLPDVRASLAEIEAAAADGADGFCLLTNHHGHYLGSPALDPVLAELDRRRATVFVHPTTPCAACDNPSDGSARARAAPATPLAPAYPAPMFEFFFETARAVTHLFLSGAVARFANLTFVVPHAGGCLPPLLARVTGFSGVVAGQAYHATSEADARAALNARFYFDLAGWAFPGQVWGLTRGCGVGVDRLLYGSDFPFTSAAAAAAFAEVMDEEGAKIWRDDEVEMAYRGNAMRLLGIERGEAGES